LNLLVSLGGAAEIAVSNLSSRMRRSSNADSSSLRKRTMRTIYSLASSLSLNFESFSILLLPRNTS
jgi:hypothetical protein